MCHIFPFPDLQSGAIWFLFYAKNKKYTFYTLSLYLLVSNSASTIAGVYPELKIEKAVPDVFIDCKIILVHVNLIALFGPLIFKTPFIEVHVYILLFTDFIHIDGYDPLN